MRSSDSSYMRNFIIIMSHTQWSADKILKHRSLWMRRVDKGKWKRWDDDKCYKKSFSINTKSEVVQLSKRSTTGLMMQRTTSSAFFLLSLLLFAYVCDARKDPGDYWKSIMDEETMPKAIADILYENSNTKTDCFVRNFETKPNVIIYHSHDHDHDHKSKPNSDMEG